MSTVKNYKQGAIRYLEKLKEIELQHLYTKPFCLMSFEDCSTRFHDFANIITVLQLKGPRRILDVGCGPGWLSEYLTRLGHKVTGIDISPGMIEIAEKRVSVIKYTVNQKPLDVKFHIQDAERLALDEKFHIAIFYDSLHHFEDKERVLANIFDVLVDGGRVLIHEGVKPPEGSSEQKKLEEVMEKYETLEDPLHPSEIRQMMEISGFVDIVSFVAINQILPQGSIPLKHLVSLFGVKSSINIFLGKKPARSITSDDPNILKAKIAVSRIAKVFRPNEQVKVRTKVKNTGDTIWLSAPNDCGGCVLLGAKMFNAQGQLINEFIPWVLLPGNVYPGETVELILPFEAPAFPGKYTLVIDMVDEFIAWFSERGSESYLFDFKVIK